MFIERFEDKGLSHYSYAVGCPGAGLMAVVDPRRDIDVYLDYAHREGLRIAYVMDTHIHADFASGARELAERTGAELWLSGYDAGEIFDVTFPHREMYEGDSVSFGAVRIEALHTPGHTPEHLAFLVFDQNRSATVPMAMLSGDFLFVGSLGRPDLLGEESKRGLAKQQYASVQKLAKLPDGLEIHPAHGAGSMCGAGMSGRPMSTLGFERIANPYLDPALTEAAFVERILTNVPLFPEYYKRMKRVNSVGAPTLGGLPGLHPLEVSDVARRIEDGAVVIDLRDQLGFGAGHIPGSFGITAGEKVAMWAAWVVPYETPIVLVAPSAAALELAVRGLVRVGLDDVQGYLEGGIEAWIEAGHPIDELPQISAAEAFAKASAGQIHLLDVREAGEFAAGHPGGAVHVNAGMVGEQIDRVPNGDRPVAIFCNSGFRSTIAASVLGRAGIRDVMNVTGGLIAWHHAGLPLVRDGA